MNTDTERLDFLERDGHVAFDTQKANCMARAPYHLFTLSGQHLDGESLRELIDTAMLYESGERCWYCEWWNFHRHKHKDGSEWKAGKAL